MYKAIQHLSIILAYGFCEAVLLVLYLFLLAYHTLPTSCGEHFFFSSSSSLLWLCVECVVPHHRYSVRNNTYSVSHIPSWDHHKIFTYKTVGLAD